MASSSLKEGLVALGIVGALAVAAAMASKKGEVVNLGKATPYDGEPVSNVTFGAPDTFKLKGYSPDGTLLYGSARQYQDGRRKVEWYNSKWLTFKEGGGWGYKPPTSN